MSSPALAADTLTCLRDFFRRHRWDNVQTLTANFAGVRKDTVREWKGHHTPKGGELLAVRVLLDTAGYRVMEFTTLPRPLRQFSQALAFGVIQPDEAQRLLEYASIKGVYGVLLRNTGFMRHRQLRLQAWVDQHSQEIETKVTELRAELADLPVNSDYTPPSVPAPSDRSEGKGVHDRSERTAEAFASTLRAAGELASLVSAEADQLVPAVFLALDEASYETVLRRLTLVLSQQQSIKSATAGV